MIQFKTGDIFVEDAEALVNTVNCVGVMGRGIALQFKKAFPENFRAYVNACRRGDVRPGRMFLFEMEGAGNPRYIINFPTKRHWRGSSRIGDIEMGLIDLARLICEREIRSIAVPPLGSGLGGLEWDTVRQCIEDALRDLGDLRVVVFEPSGAPVVGNRAPSLELPEMTESRAVLIRLMDVYLNGLLDPIITLLEVHKLIYFMQFAGQRLNLRFSAGPYGPYAENLRHVIHAIEGHFISGYADGGDAPDKPLELVPGAVEDARATLAGLSSTQDRLDRVTDLVDGFESSFGLELLSTVHWILKDDTAMSRDDLVARVHGWNDRKKRFSPQQIALAADVLIDKGWAEIVEPAD